MVTKMEKEIDTFLDIEGVAFLWEATKSHVKKNDDKIVEQLNNKIDETENNLGELITSVATTINNDISELRDTVESIPETHALTEGEIDNICNFFK